MKIRFWGAAGEVTGSAYEVETAQGSFFVDMGMFQGVGAEEKNRRVPETNFLQIKACLLTHAHLDHCGRIPVMVKEGFMGKIWATKPTIDLVEIVWRDALHIATSENGQALYSETDVNTAVSLLVPVEYDEWFEVVSGVRARYFDAGHILGSASIELLVEERKARKRVIFSGDLGNSPSPLVAMTKAPVQGEVVVMESTYGDRLHEPRGSEERIIAEICHEVVGSGGTVLMPAFSLERTQEFLHMFDHLKRTGAVSAELPVFLDSPMGLRATAVFEKYPMYFNEHMRGHFGKDDPFDFPGLRLLMRASESHKVSEMEGPKVIIAGSGMMTGGRIVAHARRHLPWERNIIVFSGYQAEGTLGREILGGSKEVAIGGLLTSIRARVVEITTMSGHADRRQLLDWLFGIDGARKVFLTHGEDVARKSLFEELRPGLEVEMPGYGQVYEI